MWRMNKVKKDCGSERVLEDREIIDGEESGVLASAGTCRGGEAGLPMESR